MANIPSPVYTGSGRQGLPESLLLTIASAAPQLLMQYLDMRQRSTQQEAEGQAALGAAAELSRQGTLSPDLFRSMQGNVRAAPGMLSTVMGAQQSAAATEASKAQTALAKSQDTREAALQEWRIKEIKEGLINSKFTRGLESRKVRLAESTAKRQANNEAAGLQIERERLGLQRREALQNTQSRLSDLYNDQFGRFTAMAQLYASVGLPADAARARASADVFRTTKPPTVDEFLGANIEKATAGILQSQDGDPDLALVKTIFGDRPDVEWAQTVGVSPEQVEFINQQLELNKGDAAKTYSAVASTIPLEGDAKDAELSKILAYLTYKNGATVTLPAAEKSRLRAFIKSGKGGILDFLIGSFEFGQNVGEGLLENKPPTERQKQQMNSGVIQGWAPPDR